MATSTDLRSARQAVLDAHSAAESARDLDGVLATFHRARYEIVPTGEVFDGEEAVREYHGENFRGIPDFTVEPIRAFHSDDVVVEEAWASGTHLGTYHGLPPTGRFVKVQVCGIYVFEEDRLVCERVYYDLLTVLQGLGVARDPDSALGQAMTLVNHPVHLARTFARDALNRDAGAPEPRNEREARMLNAIRNDGWYCKRVLGDASDPAFVGLALEGDPELILVGEWKDTARSSRSSSCT